MKFEWDEEKRKANLAKHGLDFASIIYFDFENAMEVEQSKNGEYRIFAISTLTNQVCALAYTPRNEIIRVISLRLATKREIQAYVEYLSF